MSTNAAFPPYEMTTDNGGFEGIDVEIATAIAEKLGLELVVDDMDFDAALLAAQNGKSDIVMAGVTVNDDRLLVMDFSDSYATGIQSIIVKEGSDIQTVDDLGNADKIGTQRATTGNIYCEDDYGADHVVAYDNGMTAIAALVNGQVDAVVIDNAPAQEFVAANPGLVILDTEYAVEDYAIGTAKGNTALLDAINGALAELTADGTVQSILDKYISAE
jgi:polar amino acid transport system substrate-binding protein